MKPINPNSRLSLIVVLAAITTLAPAVYAAEWCVAVEGSRPRSDRWGEGLSGG